MLNWKNSKLHGGIELSFSCITLSFLSLMRNSLKLLRQLISIIISISISKMSVFDLHYEGY